MIKQIIEELYGFDRQLLGSGYDNAIKYIDHLIGLDVFGIRSGTEIDTWTVPKEWVVRDAWVKFNGKKILDYKENPLSLMVYSEPFKGKINLEEFQKHLHFSDTLNDATPYEFSFYKKDWGFCMPKTSIFLKDGMNCEGGLCVPELKDIDPTVGKIQIEGVDYSPKWSNKMPEGEYEVFIDSEFRDGTMNIGVHTIKGKTDREILLFAHLDHPQQANDNLSAVACLIDLAKKIKCESTIKIVFCPETIGSIAYAKYHDLTKVDFMIAIDICGNDNSLLLQKSFDAENRINKVAHLAIQGIGESYRKGMFRSVIGSDEYVFNDPKIGIPGLMLSRYPYKEYHTSEDTPDKINVEKIEQTGKVVMKIIEIWEKDFIPRRTFYSPLMRSKYDIQTKSPQVNLSYDYFFYSMDGEKTLSELCCDFGLNFDFTYELIEKMINDNNISRINISKIREYETRREKYKKLPRKTNVSGKRRKVS